MTRRTIHSTIIILIALALLFGTLIASARSQPERVESRIETITAAERPLETLDPRRPALEQLRDTWLFHRWVQAVLDQQRAFLEAALELHREPFLVCTRSHESSPTPPWHDDGYDAISPNRLWYGAYQFALGTWDNTARHAGLPHLVGTRPDQASMFDQDRLAWELYQWQGADPWNDRCARP